MQYYIPNLPESIRVHFYTWGLNSNVLNELKEVCVYSAIKGVHFILLTVLACNL